jgi:hypothetical protein
MAMAVVGFAFEDSIGNGGEAILRLGFYHAQMFKVAQKCFEGQGQDLGCSQ